MATITKETFKVQGEKVLNKVKELVKEGNVRKISIHEKDGRELMSFPLSLGVVGQYSHRCLQLLVHWQH
jgi:hypothetical protein